jgi:hypothetical protein
MSTTLKAGASFLVLLLLSSLLTSCQGQKVYGTGYLKLEKIIPLPGVKGRIDHLDVNVKDGVVYIAALGNNTLEAVDLQRGKVIQSIKRLDEPQGVGFIPQTNEVFVANGGNGLCYFYNAVTFQKVAAIHLSSDADDVRYDASTGKIYVGYGEGGIAVIDAATHRQTADVKLPVHPEGFQIDKKAGKLFVNLPDAHAVGEIDLKSMKLIKEWKTGSLYANFPMTLDTIHQLLFIGYRRPARLAVLDSQLGKMIMMKTMTGDADDLYYDVATQRIYVSGGSGYIDIFKQRDPRTYIQIAHIPSRSGARTSLFIPQLHLFLLAARASGGELAQMMVYKTVQ